MLSHEFIAELHCPCCGSSFHLESEVPEAGESRTVRFGILRCACYRYPIVEGIAILRQQSGPADTNDEVTSQIESQKFDRALAVALQSASPIPRTHRRWQALASFLGKGYRTAVQDQSAAALSFKQALTLHRPSSYADYLFHRNANNSFLAAIPLILLLKEVAASTETEDRETWFLDLNCGVGHASFLARRFFPALRSVATDHDFVNLYLARRYMVPGSVCLCLDAELPLPFGEDFLDAVLCLDGLHYVRSKRALIKELDRISRNDAIWLFPHMHNALQTNFSPGVPLRPEDYQRCFDFLPIRTLVESEVFRTFMLDQELDLGTAKAPAELESAQVLSLVASRRSNLWRRHDDLKDLLLANKSAIAINPVYQATGNAPNAVRLQMSWPAPFLEKECEPVREFLPQEVNLDSGLWARLCNHQVRSDDEPTVNELMKKFVVVPLPSNYS